MTLEVCGRGCGSHSLAFHLHLREPLASAVPCSDAAEPSVAVLGQCWDDLFAVGIVFGVGAFAFRSSCTAGLTMGVPCLVSAACDLGRAMVGSSSVAPLAVVAVLEVDLEYEPVGVVAAIAISDTFDAARLDGQRRRTSSSSEQLML